MNSQHEIFNFPYILCFLSLSSCSRRDKLLAVGSDYSYGTIDYDGSEYTSQWLDPKNQTIDSNP
jgi:hypothetical protein